MDKGKELKRLERLAKSMLLGKEIPAPVMDKVRVLLNNEGLTRESRYREIIGLVQNLPDKKVLAGEEIELRDDRKPKARIPEEGKKKKQDQKVLMGPTETSLYVDSLFLKYKPEKLFKKRYLAHRSNKLGIGLRKRLVPTRGFKHLLETIADLHESVIYRLTDILDNIIFDQDMHDPATYNYLKVFYRWMSNVPLLRTSYEKIVWMERGDFDREFKGYITFFFSFYKMGASARETLIQEIERRLQSRSNIKEKDSFAVIGAVRFFLPATLDETGPVAKRLFGTGDIKNLPGLLFAVTEALIFQRTFSVEELIDYYGIMPPTVSLKEWDCSPDLLEKAGKNRLQQIRAELERLNKRLGLYESLMTLLSMKEEGELLVYRSLREYWRTQLSKEWQPQQTEESHFYLFAYSLISGFMEVYFPLLGGAPVHFRDYGREEMEGTLFSPSYFEEDIRVLVNGHRQFKKTFAGKSITRAHRESVRPALDQPQEGEDSIIGVIKAAGDAFYRIGKELLRLLENHRVWKFNGGTVKSLQDTRSFLDRRGDAMQVDMHGPFPYYDCLLTALPGAGVLGRDLYGRRIIDDSTNEGIIVSAAAYMLQAAHALMNRSCIDDIEARNDLANQAEALSAQLK